VTEHAGLRPRNVTRVISAILTAAKLPHVRFHDLRHSAASPLIAEGVALAEVCVLLGPLRTARDDGFLRALTEADGSESGAHDGRDSDAALQSRTARLYEWLYERGIRRRTAQDSRIC